MNDIQRLHAVYNQLTGFALSLDFGRERAWYQFLKQGRYKEDDLRLVLIHLKQGIKKGYRYQGCLGFKRLIWGLDTFEEELACARAFRRNNPPPTNRQSVIRVFRPQAAEATGPTVSCRPVGDIVPKLIAELRKAAE